VAVRQVLMWPAMDALMDRTARRSNARVCDRFDRVVPVLPFPGGDAAALAPRELCP
jgi:hypothetical protein